MAQLGKKHSCFQCGTKFYDFMKPEPVCPKCGAKMKDAPAKPKAVKKEKVAHVIEDDFSGEQELEQVDEGLGEAIPFDRTRGEGRDAGDLQMDDYDE